MFIRRKKTFRMLYPTWTCSNSGAWELAGWAEAAATCCRTLTNRGLGAPSPGVIGGALTGDDNTDWLRKFGVGRNEDRCDNCEWSINVDCEIE
jgi:hypothetical protein